MTAPSVRPRQASVTVARPMFQVLFDDSQTCSCHVMRADLMCNPGAMQVSAADYDKPGRWFL